MCIYIYIYIHITTPLFRATEGSAPRTSASFCASNTGRVKTGRGRTAKQKTKKEGKGMFRITIIIVIVVEVIVALIVVIVGRDLLGPRPEWQPRKSRTTPHARIRGLSQKTPNRLLIMLTLIQLITHISL